MLATTTLLLITTAAWTAHGMGIEVSSITATIGRPRDCQDLIHQGNTYEGHYVVYPEASAPYTPTMIYCSQDEGMKPLPSDREPPRNCQDLREDGETISGIYIIYPHLDHPADPVLVSCDMETDWGGWTLIQKRFDGSVDFYRSWAEYEAGFGNINAEHYLGNSLISTITGQRSNELRVELEDWNGVTAYAHYQVFHVEDIDYKLNIGMYDGTAGNSLENHGQKFSTFDADHDWDNGNCAEHRHGAWWYGHCGYSNLNGRYYPRADTNDAWDGMMWHGFRGTNSLRSSVMKIRPYVGAIAHTGGLHNAHEADGH